MASEACGASGASGASRVPKAVLFSGDGAERCTVRYSISILDSRASSSAHRAFRNSRSARMCAISVWNSRSSLRLRAYRAGSRGRDASGISGTGLGGGIMPWRSLPRRHVERGGVAGAATGSTGSCGVGGRDVSEALEAFDLDVRDARRSRTRASRRRTRACAASCRASANSALASSSDDVDDSIMSGLESPAVRSTTGHATGISTVLDSSVEEIVMAG